MHNYLKSIGFSNVAGKKELDKIIEDVIQNSDEKIVVEENGRLFTELSKMYGTNFGLTVCGEYDENDEFQMEYYFPYFRGTGVTMQEDVIIEKHGGNESFAGACDDMRIGVTIIFYLQNAGEYLLKKSKGNYSSDILNVTLSGLVSKGKILLPVLKKDDYEEKRKDNTVNRSRLIAAAKNGDEEAIESLTIEDMDTYSMISNRIQNEDVYSIVDTCFMPYGMECDLYNIMGEILECNKVSNIRTKDTIHMMRIRCNDMELDVCVNEKDLLGEPKVGRRFKGVVWLQGYVDFV